MIAEPGLVDSPWHTLPYECSSFRPLKSWLWSPNPQAYLIWPPVISCFWELSRGCDGAISKMSLKIRNSHWLPYVWFHNVGSNMGRNAGSIA